MFRAIYTKVKELGIPTDNHESDLYIPVTEETKNLLKDYEYKNQVTTFTSNIDKKLWFDIPFAYVPFWEKKGA